MMNRNAKSFFVCVRDERSWNIKSNKINSNLKTLNTKCKIKKKKSWNIKPKEIKNLHF